MSSNPTAAATSPRRLALGMYVASVAVLAMAAHAERAPVAPPPAGFALHSPDFEAGAEIPARFTCEGKDVSPALVWSAPPPGTKSLALVVDDPDAPDPRAPRITWVHWVLYNLPPEAGQLPAAVKDEALPDGTREGQSSWKRTGYGGPCPPIGKHRYFFKLYALDTVLSNKGALSKGQLERAMTGHVLRKAELMGTYEKTKP